MKGENPLSKNRRRLLSVKFLCNLKHFVSLSLQILAQKTSEEGVGQNVISAEVFAVSLLPSIITSIMRSPLLSFSWIGSMH